MGEREEGRKRNTERMAAKFQDMPKLDCNRNYCNGFIGAYESERKDENLTEYYPSSIPAYLAGRQLETVW